MDVWTTQDASRELRIDEGYLRKVLNDSGIPGVERVGRQWLGAPEHWRRWDESRTKRRRRK